MMAARPMAWIRHTEVLTGLALALALLCFDLGEIIGRGLEAPYQPTPIVEGWRDLKRHRVFVDRGDAPRRVLMLGACQVSGLYCHFGAPLDRQGRCATPHLLEEQLARDPSLGRVEVDNLGMDGTGYLTTLYFLLETLEVKGVEVVIHSVAQGGTYFLTGDPRINAKIFALVAALRERLSEVRARHPDIPELADLERFLDALEDDAHRSGKLSRAVTARRPRAGATLIAGWQRNSAFLSDGLFSWLREFRELPRRFEAHPDVAQMLSSFEERYDDALVDPPLAVTAGEITLHRAVARLMQKYGRIYVIESPPDLDAQKSDEVDRVWWQPLRRALADLDNIVFWDLSRIQLTRGRDLYNHAQRTYYGNRVVAEAMHPRLLELLNHAPTNPQ